MSPLEMILIGAIGTAILGIGGFITWFAKLVIPKFLEYSDKLVIEIAGFRQEFMKIPETMVRFESKLDNHSSITNEAKNEVVQMRKDLADKRFEDLQNQINRNTERSTNRVSIVNEAGKN